MGTFTVGDVVVLPFPFSDLSKSKKRPALVLAYAGRQDWVCLQITSKSYGDNVAIRLAEADFAIGSLERESFIRPGKLFTAHDSLFDRNVARIQNDKLDEVKDAIVKLVQQGAFS
ncbi:type II toxin-antitoxin system PemK/MazF family toxin [Tepidiphilus baoligensis]|uniref:MazF family transcriptional regulator n=1 Tax=Tepidiphilus baoligensis TaxID=2698687 RepID=A0ABX1QMA1_9PROT|nr:type II toxin-antitoxin system PemK/MazF family toxin [Tepidiphilus baoligensis]NMH16541.1 MazF family transcriptional regulator [Tepidiphilus baoligensis]